MGNQPNHKMRPVIITPTVGRKYGYEGVGSKITKEDTEFWYFSDGARWPKHVPFTMQEISIEQVECQALEYSAYSIELAKTYSLSFLKKEATRLNAEASMYATQHLAALNSSRGGIHSTMRQAYASNQSASIGQEAMMYEQAIEILTSQTAFSQS